MAALARMPIWQKSDRLKEALHFFYRAGRRVCA
jgi:hypothetical protein